jgi:hypothetical protein
MDLDDALSVLIFLCIFEVIGGAAVGTGLRGFLRLSPRVPGCFMMIWGLGFGGIPLLIGGGTMLMGGNPAFFYAQAFVFLSAVVIVALLPQELLETNQQGKYQAAIVGAIMFVIGAALLVLLWGDADTPVILGGGAITLVGAVLLIRGVVNALREI